MYTIVYLVVGTVYATWPFIPQYMSDKYKVCVYDRRGYGWSETYESDYLTALDKYPQWAKNNVEFLRSLVDVARIRKPFYLAGHSYGGHHLLYMALKYPELIKGLIFLDSSAFSALDILEEMLELVSNLQPTGLLSIVLDQGWFDYESAFSDYIQVSEMPSDIESAFVASMKSGTYFQAYTREDSYIDYSRDHVTKDLGDTKIDIPTLVIDAGGKSGWFPEGNFPKFQPGVDHIGVPSASHSGLTLSKQYGNITAQHI